MTERTLQAMFDRLQSVEWHLHLDPPRLGAERRDILAEIAAEATRLRAEYLEHFGDGI